MGNTVLVPESNNNSPEEAINSYINFIYLFANESQSEKKLSTKQCVDLLKKIASTAWSLSNQLSPSTADNFGRSILEIRKLKPTRFTKLLGKYSVQLDDARAAVCSKIFIQSYILPPVNAFADISKECWTSRVASILSTSAIFQLGGSTEFGMSGGGANELGYCIEMWIKPKSNEDVLLFMANGASKSNDPIIAVKIFEMKLMIIYGKMRTICKDKTFTINIWTHIAFVVGSNMIKVAVDGRNIFYYKTTYISSHLGCSFAAGKLDLCELRIWNMERSDAEIQRTMALTIPPSSASQFPGLRLCWFPLAVGGTVYPSGSLLYDVWARQPVGHRQKSTPLHVPDSRWLSAFPPLFTLPVEAPWMTSFESEFSECLEIAELSFASQSLQLLTPQSQRLWEADATSAMNSLRQLGCPWIPRSVCLPPSMAVTFSESSQYGFMNDRPFTIETWVRVHRAAAPPDTCNAILGFGPVRQYCADHMMFFAIRQSRLVFSFGSVDVESDTMIPTMSWTHVAVVCDDNGFMHLFVNGIRNRISKQRRPTPPVACSLVVGAMAPTSAVGSSSSGTGGGGGGQEEREAGGGYVNSLRGDLCEMRVWSIALPESVIGRNVSLSIPVNETSRYPGLRISWLPLRRGGPWAQQLWQRRLEVQGEMVKNNPKTASESESGPSSRLPPPPPPHCLSSATPSLFWDVSLQRDCGFLPGGFTLPATRIRTPPVPSFTANSLTPSSSSSSSSSSLSLSDSWRYPLAVIDEWSDAFEESTISAESYFPLASPPSPTPSVAQSNGWIPRVVKFPLPGYVSSLLGTTGEIGLASAAFTVELWIKYTPVASTTSGSSGSRPSLMVQNILGNEEPESVKKTGFLGMGKSEALRMGLVDGRPYIGLHGALKQIHDVLIVSRAPLSTGAWSHVAFACSVAGCWKIYVDGVAVATSSPNNPLGVLDSANVHCFGWSSNTTTSSSSGSSSSGNNTELGSPVTEMRIWSYERSVDQIQYFKDIPLPPRSDGSAPVDGLRYAWLPLQNSHTLFYDVLQHQFKGRFQAVCLSRRPYLLPALLLSKLSSLPNPSVVDDEGDAFDAFYLSNILVQASQQCRQSLDPTVSLQDVSLQLVQHQHQHQQYNPYPGVDLWDTTGTGDWDDLLKG